MAASDLVNLSGLLDDARCFALVRQHRWPTGVRCPGCDSSAVTRDGHDDTQGRVPPRGVGAPAPASGWAGPCVSSPWAG